MQIATNWQDYELIDAANYNRLERWGDVILVRPDPQVIWRSERQSKLWHKADAVYHRSSSGGGQWEQKRTMPQKWQIKYKDLCMAVSPTNFKHTGVFPEQAVNWDAYRALIKQRLQQGKQAKVLNLFGYTGLASLACAAEGAHVCHVDASKGMVAWGKENAKLSNLSDKPIRWIVDDCAKFVAREIKRGVKYDAIIMDPPSYGRGPGGEIWKFEDNIYDFIVLCEKVLSENPLFLALNSYTTGISPSVTQYVLKTIMQKKYGGTTKSDEIGLPVSGMNSALPCGATAWWLASEQI